MVNAEASAMFQKRVADVLKRQIQIRAIVKKTGPITMYKSRMSHHVQIGISQHFKRKVRLKVLPTPADRFFWDRS